MDEILFISYYFPPLGGAGVQRPLKFCRYLPEEGIRPVVIAGPRTGSGGWEPTDMHLADELPEGTETYRAEGEFPPLSAQSRLEKLAGRPPQRYAWWRKSLHELGLRALARHRPRAIFITLSPFEGLESAITLARRANLPLIADLRDPWALDEVTIYPTRLHRWHQLRKMRGQLSRCSRVLWNTPEALAAATEAFPELSDKFHCLTNGFDRSDYVGAGTRSPDGRFRIVHTGYLHAELGNSGISRRLGGELWPIDFRGRSHYYLLRALELIQDRHPDTAKRLELEFVGLMTRADEALIRASRASGLCRSPGYAEHSRAVRAQVSADLLFLPMHGMPEGCRSRIVPAKTYEYLASGRPILAAVPEGDARDFVQAASAGRVVHPADVEGIANAILSFIGEAPSPLRPLGETVLRFERRTLTRALAHHLRESY